jgi:glycine cleavage system H protein
MGINKLKYTKEHEWVLLENETATIGITSYAAEELGDIVYVELPEKGFQIDQTDECGTIESVKTLANIYAPLSGEIVDINDDLVNDPNKISQEPYSNGWLVKLNISNHSEYEELMNYEEYQEYIDTL